MASHSDFLVIGAGMAGLTCATKLAGAGHNVRVLDKGRGPGGRMAARRVEIAGDVISFDHGAQYFTARDPAFRATVADWEAQGIVASWPAAGVDAWVGAPGMNAPIRAMAGPLDVRWNMRALSVRRDGAGWKVEAGEESFSADTLLVAVPAEQACDLLVGQALEFSAIADAIHSEPCWAVMAAFDERLNVVADIVRDEDAAISWAARNSAKPGRSGKECWVLHASPARTREVLDLPKDAVAPLLLADFFAQTGAATAQPIHLVAHRWLYAMPSSFKGDPAHFDMGARVGIAGDYLHSPRVEGAFLSGFALADKALAHILTNA